MLTLAQDADGPRKASVFLHGEPMIDPLSTLLYAGIVVCLAACVGLWVVTAVRRVGADGERRADTLRGGLRRVRMLAPFVVLMITLIAMITFLRHIEEANQAMRGGLDFASVLHAYGWDASVLLWSCLAAVVAIAAEWWAGSGER